jgi:hypothetical protein
MPYEVEIIQHQKYVEAMVSGEFDLQIAVDKFDKVLIACKINNLSKVLIDFRNSSGKIYAVQKIIYALQAIDKIIFHFASRGKDLQFAYVGKPSHVSTYQPGIELAGKEGIQAILTDNLDEAFEWLDIKKT